MPTSLSRSTSISVDCEGILRQIIVCAGNCNCKFPRHASTESAKSVLVYLTCLKYVPKKLETVCFVTSGKRLWSELVLQISIETYF
ncbi:predicted protein [Sclerotinia sclerotiorum 1980 UF-70]|uniref:Uncharacterized protein n=1 Tax=Sclerotinia sclerotiorum (strain ATCC 18683 / 1980 / Ss-1) TaxID=665079 RepID=A7FA28_SCLS1|nr:predicted protein [Sclerotinia sclerotiorum 1980 UF-70]EDO00589.1 predicted protein [Sclerotinia sclerotiorum 1980 UF-70]